MKKVKVEDRRKGLEMTLIAEKQQGTSGIVKTCRKMKFELLTNHRGNILGRA